MSADKVSVPVVETLVPTVVAATTAKTNAADAMVTVAAVLNAVRKRIFDISLSLIIKNAQKCTLLIIPL